MIHAVRRFILRAVWVLPAFGLCLPAQSSDNEWKAAFDDANLLYEKADFEAAAQAYEAIVHGGTRTAPLLFNLGNAYFKSDQIGLAVASWLQAEALEPRNRRIQINLEFARSTVSGGATPVPSWPDQLRWLTLNEWTGALLAFSWICFGGLGLGVWKPKWRAILRLPIALAGLAMVVLAGLLAITYIDRTQRTDAVVINDEAVVRFGPLKESQSNFVARDGTEFRAVDFKDDWVRVVDAAGREGWLMADQLILLQGGRPTSYPEDN